MPTIASIDGIKIQVYADDHNPPHFHALKAEFEVLIRIGTWEILQGQMRRKDLETVLDWAKSRERELTNEWNNLNER